MTGITMTPMATGSGNIGITASAAAFDVTDDLDRLLAIKLQAPLRTATTAYVIGKVVYADDRGVTRLYRCIQAGITEGTDMAGTTPDYDQNTPTLETSDVVDGSVVWYFMGKGKSAWGWGKIVSVSSTTLCFLLVSENAPLASVTPSLSWRLGEWGRSRGWPRTVAIYSSRMFWGGSLAKPQTIWGSNLADYENMTPTEPDGSVLDTNATTHTLDDDELNTILWMLNLGRGLAIGSPSAEFLFGPAIPQQAFGPLNTKAKREGKRGSTDMAIPVRAEDVAVFVQRGGTRQRELVYDYGTDTYRTGDLTILSEHITASGIVDSALQDEPNGTIWHVLADGSLIAMTYDREQKVRAWTRHVLAGGALVESIACVPAPDAASDDLYLSVNRGGVRRIEFIRAPFRSEIDGEVNAFFVDSGLTYDGAPTTTITGLAHLNGVTVSVRADGIDLGSAFVVSGGSITLATAASVVHVGRAMTSRVTTLPNEATSAPGNTSQARMRRTHEVVLRLLETEGGEYGRDDTMEPIRETQTGLFTGDSREVFPVGWDRAGQMTVQHTGNGPLTILAIIQEVQVNA